MRHVRSALAAAAIGLALQTLPAGLTAAAEGDKATTGAEESPAAIDQKPPENVQNTLGGGRLAAGQFNLNELVGMTVISADGQDVGEVADVIINAEDGRIDELVVESDSIIGIGYTAFGVDWSNVKLERGSDQVTLTVTQEQMTEGFKKKQGGKVQE